MNVKTGFISKFLGNIILVLEGFRHEDATLTWMDGRAFGGRHKLGY